MLEKLPDQTVPWTEQQRRYIRLQSSDFNSALVIHSKAMRILDKPSKCACFFSFLASISLTVFNESKYKTHLH